MPYSRPTTLQGGRAGFQAFPQSGTAELPEYPGPRKMSLQTFIKQALVTTCFGSTMSTRGSFMATSRMQLMSKP